MSQIKNPTCLYIAGLFHDIGKGQGEDHSQLGAMLATHFCHEHHLSKADTQLIVWLVANHLLMSTVAQKQDISDPDVLANFVKQLANQDYFKCTVCTYDCRHRSNQHKLMEWLERLLA